jgi:hypothetical protein
MGKKTTILYLLLSLFGLNQGFSQQKVVTGKVTSQEDNSPLIGVSVVIKGTNTGTTTTPNGTFRLNYLKGSTLVFSFIGYQTKEVIDTTYQGIPYLQEAGQTGVGPKAKPMFLVLLYRPIWI